MFGTLANNISEAYEYIKAIINNEKTTFPNQDETLLNYMEILVNFKCNGKLFHDGPIIGIEKIDVEDK